MERFWEMDFARGTAILMMVVFHFAWDLNYFGVAHFSLYTGTWSIFQKATVSLFLLVSGATLSMNYGRKDSSYARYALKRGVAIFGAGLLVTAFTLVFFPSEFVYFGILHLIGVCTVLSVPMAGKRRVALVVAAIALLAPVAVDLQALGVAPLVWLGLAKPFPTLDFQPVLPWFGVFALGMALGGYLYDGSGRKFPLGGSSGMASRAVRFLGRNSLAAYLLHQGILFPLAYIFAHVA